MAIEKLLIPKNDDLIMSQLLATDEKNIPELLCMYDHWMPIFYDDNKSLAAKISYFKNNVNVYNFYDDRSTGVRGLKRQFSSYEQGRLQLNLLEECISDWLHWITIAKIAFKNKAKREFTVLKPKSKQQIINDFINLPLSKQVEVLDDNEDVDLPIGYWPLLLRIKEKLKSKKSFYSYYRCTSNDFIRKPISKIWSNDYIGVSFKIANRNNNKAIIVYQYNNCENVVISAKINNTDIIRENIKTSTDVINFLRKIHIEYGYFNNSNECTYDDISGYIQRRNGCT